MTLVRFYFLSLSIIIFLSMFLFLPAAAAVAPAFAGRAATAAFTTAGLGVVPEDSGNIRRGFRYYMIVIGFTGLL